MGMWVVDGLHAFGSSVTEEIYGMLIQILFIRISLNNIGLYRTDRAQGTVVYSCIHLHSAGIDHRTKQCILFDLLTKQNGNAQQFQGRNANQFDITTIANTFGHRSTDS